MRCMLFLKKSKTRMNNLFALQACLVSLLGCGNREVAMSLKELSMGRLSLSLYSDGLATFLIDPEDRFSTCTVLTGTVTASLNGRSPTSFSRGGLGPEQDEGYRSCQSPQFLFALESFDTAPGAPDGEFVVGDGSYSMRLNVANLLAERKVIRLKDPAILKPGDQMKFGWLPTTDIVLDGTSRVDGRGNYFFQFGARVESQQLVTILPNEPWPAEAVLYFTGSATIPIEKCEGVRTCQVIDVSRQDIIDLPKL